MSLRARLLIVIAVLLITFAATAILVVENQRSLLIEQIDRRLTSAPPAPITTISGGAVSTTRSGGPDGPNPPTDTYSDIYIGIVDPNGEVQPQVVGSLLSTTPDLAQAVSGVPHAGYRTISSIDGADEFRALAQPIPNGNGYLVTALPLQEVNDAISRLQRTLLFAGLVIVAVLAALYFWIQRLGLAPITRLAATAEAVTAGDHSQRAIDTDPRTEAGKLGIAFNVMLDERDLAESRLRQFVADASHELRTPLTSMRGYLDLYRQGAFREQEQLDDVVRRLSSETNRMTDLVKDLLSLVSLDEGRPLRREQVDLGRILRDAAQDAQAVQPNRPIAADTPATGPVVCADEGLLVQLVSILVTNAMHHTPGDAALALRVETLANGANITISDAGPGFETQAAEHAFDRFWRGESSRQRNATGGSGLGLSIANAIVEAHNGSIALDTAPGRGSTFTIVLPSSLERCIAEDQGAPDVPTT